MDTTQKKLLLAQLLEAIKGEFDSFDIQTLDNEPFIYLNMGCTVLAEAVTVAQFLNLKIEYHVDGIRI